MPVTFCHWWINYFPYNNNLAKYIYIYFQSQDQNCFAKYFNKNIYTYLLSLYLLIIQDSILSLNLASRALDPYCRSLWRLYTVRSWGNSFMNRQQPMTGSASWELMLSQAEAIWVRWYLAPELQGHRDLEVKASSWQAIACASHNYGGKELGDSLRKSFWNRDNHAMFRTRQRWKFLSKSLKKSSRERLSEDFDVRICNSVFCSWL